MFGSVAAFGAETPEPLGNVWDCDGTDFFWEWNGTPGVFGLNVNCGNTGTRCYISGEPSYFFRLKSETCDPTIATCEVQLVFSYGFPGVEENIDDNGTIFGLITPKIYWDICADGSCSQHRICGLSGVGGQINMDFVDSFTRANAGCLETNNLTTVFRTRGEPCGSSSGSCASVETSPEVRFGGPELAAAIGCPPTTKPSGCGDGDAGAEMCCFGAGGSNSPDGSGPGSKVPGTNAAFVYQAGGVGYPGSPGSDTWIADTGLGRYWVHEFATRIVPNPDQFDVYLITAGGTYRHFVDTNMDDLYDQVSPSDEFRTLEFNQPTMGEWQLTDLDGTVTVFNADGSFQSRSNRLGHTWAASYSSGLLDTVTFPDGRQEAFVYDGGGRLEEIQQIGLESDGSVADCSTPDECRSWFFTWDGADLERIDYPDLTARVFSYGEPLYPGYMTLRELEGTNGTDRRVEGAWEYTAAGRIHKTWRGAYSFDDLEAADKYEYTSYDDEAMPTEVEITDPFGNPVTYTIGYDDVSSKPRLEGVEGECPSCGGPNQTVEYQTPGNELLPSARIDGEGNRTEYLYDTNGRVTDRFEAVGSGDSRTISYQYDGNYPGLVSLEERPSTSGSGFRTTSWVYHSTLGYLESMTAEGDELGYDDGSGGPPEDAFVLTTNYLNHNAAGRPGEVDPPGFDGVGDPSDSTLFTYDVPGRNGLLADSRTDPVLSVATTYEYDGLNRLTRITDPNAIVTESTYDPLDRVDDVTQAQGLPEALTTDYQYNTYGDLERVVYPRGNVMAYEYDDAGRLIAVSRQAAVALTVGDERTVYTLNSFGQREREDQQTWDGATWQTVAATKYNYSSRCYLDSIVHNPDSGADEITEYDYDCDGNLERVWDANHLSAGQTAAPTQVYVYDALNRMVELREPWVPGTDCGVDPAPANCSVTTYAYDDQDHLVSVTDAEGNETTYSYSDRDLMTSEVSPVSGMTLHRFNDHGELVGSTDARGVTMLRTVDPLDRVTQIDYPDPGLQTVFAYDTEPAICGGTSLPIGRLSSIARHNQAIDYCYDHHGRTTRDGEMTYSYDDNGNRTRIGYPGGVMATYDYDFADRQASLTVDPGSGALGVVNTASYLPGGPLDGLTLGNGLVESRPYTDRYFPDAIQLDGGTLLEWDYTTDAVGNITAIDDLITPADGRTFGYKDPQYFLTSANGPWPDDLTWTYDQIGNREDETRNGTDTDDYVYVSNGSGNTAILDEIQLFGGGQREYVYGPAGHLEEIDSMSNVVTMTYDDEGRLSTTDRAFGGIANFRYDGRSFLSRASDPILFADGFEEGTLACWSSNEGGATGGTCSNPQVGMGAIDPIYDSAGLLHCRLREQESEYVFYFAGRPVATLRLDGGLEQWTFLTTDHLGTPAIATDDLGGVVWDGGFEPFGGDYQAGLPGGASENGIFLRLPGQWQTDIWRDASIGEFYYNLHRWIDSGTGRYSKADPLPMELEGEMQPYLYVRANPLAGLDSLGLQTFKPCSELPAPTPCDCDKDKVDQELQSALSLKASFCDYRNSSERPPGIPAAGEDEGRTVGKIDKALGPVYRPRDPCLDWCTCQHETQHEKDLDDPRVKKMALDGIPIQQVVNWLECRAYHTSTFCNQGFARGGVP